MHDAQNPKFSIITVCLNEVQSIRKTCESIQAQLFNDFEWIVIDGQSTDGTLDLLSEYASRIHQLVSEPDNGIYDAMNKGIKLAKGAYLLFMNAGDYFYDNVALQAVSQAPDRDVLYGDVLCIDAKGDSFVKTMPNELPRNFLLRNMMPHQASFIKKELFEKYGDYDLAYKIAADFDLFVRFLYQNRATSFHVPEVLAVFKTDGISSTPRYKQLRKKENHLIRKHYFPWYLYGFKGLKMDVRLKFGL